MGLPGDAHYSLAKLLKEDVAMIFKCPPEFPADTMASLETIDALSDGFAIAAAIIQDDKVQPELVRGWNGTFVGTLVHYTHLPSVMAITQGIAAISQIGMLSAAFPDGQRSYVF